MQTIERALDLREPNFLPKELNGRAALIVGHPGHELVVHGWLELSRARQFVITDGSGGSGKSRIQHTSALLDNVHAPRGAIYGRFTDREVYTAILRRDFRLFTGLVDELAGELVREDIDYVVGDALEGYNPTHDVCRMLIGAALERIEKSHGRKLGNYAVLLDGPPNGCAGSRSLDSALCLKLAHDAFNRKTGAAAVYAEAYPYVKRVFQRAVDLYGADAFREEHFFSMTNRVGLSGPPLGRPFYETYGEQQVANGRYDEVLRYREHMLPLAEELRRYARVAR